MKFNPGDLVSIKNYRHGSTGRVMYKSIRLSEFENDSTSINHYYAVQVGKHTSYFKDIDLTKIEGGKYKII